MVAFFLSGFAGLVYEVCWIRQGSLIFGSTTFALSSVLAVFFAGLAIGSHLFGKIAQRLTRPLRLYALLEMMLAILAVATPLAFHLADDLYRPIYRSLAGTAVALFTVRILMIAIILLPPAICMGGTLPLFCRQFVTRQDRIAGAVGFLYGLNTLGAAAGCMAAGLLFLPTLGISGAIFLAAGLNVAAALMVGLLPLRVTRDEQASAPVEPPTAPAGSQFKGPRQRRLVAGLFFLTGLVALGNEVVWTRFLALLVRNSVYTYTITLTVVLFGIVLGSWLSARLYDRKLSRAFLFGILQIALGLIVLTFMNLPVGFWRGLPRELTTYIVLMMVPAILSGAIFPLANRMVLDDPTLSAATVGRMTALNTWGGIAGALLVGFATLPLLGIAVSLRLLTALSLLGGFVAWFLLMDSAQLRLRLVLAGAAVVGWFAIPWAFDTRLPADFLASRESLVDFHEGYSSSLAAVRSKASLQLEIDRLWQGKDNKSHQIVAAHVPMLIHPAPGSVLVVGLGTGQTAQRFLMYDIGRLDCVDIEPTIFAFIRENFATDWMSDPRVHLVPDDGRTLLLHGEDRYDVISLEVGQLFRPGVASFYTVEFYRRAADRLNRGGLLSQFVPLPFFRTEDFRSVVATFLQVFPHSLLWYNSNELLLIGVKDGELMLQRDRFALISANPRLRSDLEFSQWGGPAEWLNQPEMMLAGFMCGPPELAALSSNAPLLHDNLPSLEYATSKVEPFQRLEVENVQLLRRHLTPVSTLFRGEMTPERAARIDAMRERNLRDIVATAYLRTAENLDALGGPQQAIPNLEVALQWNPDNVEANRMMGDALMLIRKPQEAERFYRRAHRAQPADPLVQRGLAVLLLQTGQASEALSLLQETVQAMPWDGAVHNYLGAAYAQLGQLEPAIRHFAEAVRLRPDDASAQQNLLRARGQLGGTLPQ